jgi:hypothetical protein
MDGGSVSAQNSVNFEQTMENEKFKVQNLHFPICTLHFAIAR